MQKSKPHVTSTLVVTSCETNAFSMFVLQAYLHATHVHVGPCLRDHLNAKDTARYRSVAVM